MKKKAVIIVSFTMVVILLVLFLPIYKGSYDDGGTKEYGALLYKIVVWNKLQSEMNEDGSGEKTNLYQKTSVYWFPNNSKGIDELWKLERNGR